MPVDESPSMAVCPACTTPVWRWKVGGIEYTANPTALDAQEAITAHLGGRKLYRLTLVGGRTHIRPAWNTELTALSGAEPPTILGGHPCKAVTRPLTAPQPASGTGARPNPPRPSAGHQTPFSGPQAEPSGARTAAKRRSEVRRGPVCDRCHQPCADGEEIVGIQLGELWVWAEHVQEAACTPA